MQWQDILAFKAALSVLLFFVVGMVILWTVNEKKGMEEKEKPVL